MTDRGNYQSVDFFSDRSRASCQRLTRQAEIGPPSRKLSPRTSNTVQRRPVDTQVCSRSLSGTLTCRYSNLTRSTPAPVQRTKNSWRRSLGVNCLLSKWISDARSCKKMSWSDAPTFSRRLADETSTTRGVVLEHARARVAMPTTVAQCRRPLLRSGTVAGRIADSQSRPTTSRSVRFLIRDDLQQAQ